MRTSMVTMRGLVASAVFVALVGFSAGDDERDFEIWELDLDAVECCHTPDNFKPKTMDAQYLKCKKMYDENDYTCLNECIFLEEGLLTPQKTLDSEAVTKYFTSPDQELGPLVTASVEKCLSTYLTDLDTKDNSSCKSGADVFHFCLDREVFVNCPASMWKSSNECERLKTKVTKCKIPVIF